MNTAKIYYDDEGNERSIHWMVKNEPQWAASRIQAGEIAIKKLEQLQNTSSNNKYTAPQATPKSCPPCPFYTNDNGKVKCDIGGKCTGCGA